MIRALPTVRSGGPLLVLLLLITGCTSQARISGSQRVSASQLEEAARRPLASWQEHQRHADLVDAAAAMRDRLDAIGHVWAEVVSAPAAADDPERLPRFTVREGPRVEISDLHFTGDVALARKQLLTLAGFGRWYTTASSEAAPARLTRGLRRAGHLQARVAPVRVQWNEARDEAEVFLAIKAGPRFTVAREHLELDGDQSLHAELSAQLDPPGTVCHPRLASETGARIRSHLFNRGFRQATVVASSQLDTTLATMTVHLRVRPGVRQTVSVITIVGGRRTSRSFIERQLGDLAPGEPLSQEALDQGLSGLTFTGLYRRVQGETIPGEPAADGSIPTEVRVLLKENPTKRVDLSVGYGSYEQVRGGAEYIDDHLFGRGLRLNAGANASLKGWDTTAGLQDPYLLGPGRRIGVEVSYGEREEPSFSHHEAKATLGVSQKSRPRFDPSPYELRATYEFTRAEDLDIGAPLPGQEQAGEYTTSAIGLNLRRDTRQPKIIDPDTGTYAQLGTLISAKPLGAQVQFLEISAALSAAFNPAPWLVVTTHVGATTRDPLDDESLPIGERLFLGGDDSVRSFTQDDLGPRDADGTAIGGLTSMVGNLELRWRLFPRLRALEIATFYDLGMVSEKAWDVSGPPGQALGLGLRYRTPVGPIRLDGAYNPGNRLGAEHPYALHLAVGFAF